MNLDLVEVPESFFIMGANTETDLEAELNEEPERKVFLSSYKIQRTPVTVEQWKEFLKATNYHWNFLQELEEASPNELCPVTYVSWFDAYEFTQWLTTILGKSYSLPTEAQWEKACRGQCGQLYPWGSEEPEEFDDWQPVPQTTIPVGNCLERASPYGCLDMWQNVAEWCLDWFDENLYTYQDDDYNYNNDPTNLLNPAGPKLGCYKVWRGGDTMWQSGWPRCSYRGFSNPNEHHPKQGFRVVLNH
ncbi:MAG: formylglycine-generating enzyme family protein [Spirulinaceae cyanobacterium]